MVTAPSVRDRLSRPLRDLRISVTDRCNFRCVYCMPKSLFGADHAFLDRKELLTFEEIARLVELFAAHGVRKIRLTGGEPLVRRNVDKLVEEIAQIPGIEDIGLTTNGSLLTRERAEKLKAAGLNRLTVSLDALDNEVFQAINDVRFPIETILAAVDNAAQAGLAPVKVNMVVKRGMNERQILPMAEHFRGSGHILRFIEYMDVGNTNGWELADVVSAREIVDTIASAYPLTSEAPNYGGEVAERWRYTDGAGEIGIISSVTQPFCNGCTRARLSAEGSLYTCLFASRGYDLRAPLRAGESDAALAQRIRSVWLARENRYSALRTAATAALGAKDRWESRPAPKIEMSYIGG